MPIQPILEVSVNREGQVAKPKAPDAPKPVDPESSQIAKEINADLKQPNADPDDVLKDVADIKEESSSRSSENIGRGRDGILDALDDEFKSGQITEEARVVSKAFVSMIPAPYLDNLTVRFGEDIGKWIHGQYYPQAVTESGDFVKPGEGSGALIDFSQEMPTHAENPIAIISHEIGHHLEGYLENADLDALKKQYEDEDVNFGAIARKHDADLLGKYPDSYTIDYSPEDKIVSSLPYRYDDKLSEWVAEQIADRAVRDALDQPMSQEARANVERIYGAMRIHAESVGNWRSSNGKTDAFEEIYKKLLKGEYDPSKHQSSRIFRQFLEEEGSIADFPSPRPNGIDKA